MGEPSKLSKPRKPGNLLFIAVCCVVIATPIVRHQLKAQRYQETLSGGVVLAATQRLRGSVFEDAKILLIDYLPDGATGVVLGEPSEDEGVFKGGPVAPSHLLWLAYQPQTGALSLTGNKPTIKAGDNSFIIARFTGYAGWGEKQLEREVLKGDWRVFNASPQQLSQWLLANHSINKTSKSE